MKRIFTYISALALAVACETMYGPVQTPIEVDKAGDITITVDNVGDTDVTFTLTPATESAYYAYVVEAAAEPSELDPSLIYSGSYKDDAVSTGVIKWTKEEASKTITLSKLPYATTFQIHAVAGSPMGVVGKAATASFTTSDHVAPVLLEYESADTVVTLTFSEAIKKGEGAVSVGVYAMNSEEIATGASITTLPVATENVAVAGEIVTIKVADLPAGAFYALNYAEGAFIDPSNNKAAALESKVFYGEDTEYEPVYDGVGGRKNTEEWEFSGMPESLALTDEMVALEPAEWGIGYVYSRLSVEISYLYANKNFTWALAYGSGYGISGGKLLVLFPDELIPGSDVVINVPAELCEDYFGNFNAEYVGEATAVYDMTVPFDNVCGTFVMQQTSAFDLEPYQSLMVLEQSDDPTKGNVMMTRYESRPCNVSPIYGAYDPAAKTLTFAARQVYAKIAISEDGTQGYLMFTSAIVSGGSAGVGTDKVVFALSDDGLITEPNYYYGTAILTLEGQLKSWYNLYYACASTPYTPAPETPTQTATFKRIYSLNSQIVK